MSILLVHLSQNAYDAFLRFHFSSTFINLVECFVGDRHYSLCRRKFEYRLALFVLRLLKLFQRVSVESASVIADHREDVLNLLV